MALGNVPIDNFRGGLITAYPPSALPLNASGFMQNFDISSRDTDGGFGVLKKRRGFSVYQASVAGAAVTGLYTFVKTNGTEILVASRTNEVDSVSGGVWTSRYSDVLIAGTECNFCTFNDKVLFTNGLITNPQSWDGVAASSSNLSATSPANAYYIGVWRGRVHMWRHFGGTSRWSWSGVNDETDWTSVDNAGFLDIDPGDGDVGTGLATLPGCMILFKRYSTHVVFGYGPDSFTHRRIASVGCRAQKSVISFDQFCVFLSDRGVYAANEYGVHRVSDNIQPDMDNLTDAARGSAAAGRLRDQYWLAVDTNADGINDTVYVLDVISGVWMKYSNKQCAAFVNRKTPLTLLSGGSDIVVVRQEDNTATDNGVAITAIWESKDMDFNQYAVRKTIHNIVLDTSASAGDNVTIQHYRDGNLSGDSVNHDMTAIAAGETRVVRKTSMVDTAQSKLLRVRLSNNSANAASIFGVTIVGDVHELED